jgi:hypothetical protein
MNSDVIRISTEKVIEMASEKSSSSDEDRHHSDGEPDVASPQHGAEVDEPRQRRLSALRRCCVGHAGRSFPSVVRFKAVRGG